MSLARLLLPVALVALPGQQDLVEVPTVQFAVEDTPAPEQFRPVLDIHYDGKIFHEDDLLYDPEVHDGHEDPYVGLRTWLGKTATRMKKAHIDREAKAGPLIPDEPLLLRTDRSAPFHYVQKSMEACGTMDVLIWKIQLACQTPEGEPGRLAAYLPKDVHVRALDAEPIEKVEVALRVLEPGTKFAPGEPGKVATPNTGRFDYGEDRALEYRVGPFKTRDAGELKKRLTGIYRSRTEEGATGIPVTIDARPGTIYQDVAELLDVLIGIGFTDITFIGAYEREGR